MDSIQRAVPVPQAEVIMHGASGRLGSARHWQPVLRYIVDHLADSDAPFAAAGLARRQAAHAPIPHRSGRSDNAVCRGCSAGGCRQSTWGTSRANSPPQRITADSALQEGAPDNRFIRLIKSPDGHLAIRQCQHARRCQVRIRLGEGRSFVDRCRL